MTGEPLALRGCAPTPLASYLKALGVLRLVSSPANHVSGEAADPHARGWWENECFHLRTTLGRDALMRFFLHDYAPSPIIAPWNGGSGFYAGDNKHGFDPLATGQVAARFGNISSAIRNTVRIVADLKLAEKPEGEAKVGLVAALRAELADPALLWLDAVLALSGDGLAYPELLGTGGNDGRLDFTNNFARRLVSRAKPAGLFEVSSGEPSNEADRLLEASLLAAPVLGLCSAKIGQFAPGAAGGPNATNGYSANAEVNSWDFVLMLEGATAFAGAATRRHQHAPGSAASRATTRSGASFPFTVRAVGAGWGGVDAADENDARAEFWAPIWTRPARSLEIDSLLGEGRAVLNERTARDGLDFARAVASLGVSRGFRAFERFGFLMRAGRTYLATPIGRRSAAPSPVAQLVADLDAGGWLKRVRRVGRNEEEPGTARRAIKRLEDALFGLLAARGESREVERVIVALGHVAGWLALSPSGRKAITTPPPVLSSAWLLHADDGSAEFRVAAALAALGLPALARPPRVDALEPEAELPGGVGLDGADREPTGDEETPDSTSRVSWPGGPRRPRRRPGPIALARRAADGRPFRAARRGPLLLPPAPRQTPRMVGRRRPKHGGLGHWPARAEPDRGARPATGRGVNARAGRQAAGWRDGRPPHRRRGVPLRRLRRRALCRAARRAGVGAAGTTPIGGRANRLRAGSVRLRGAQAPVHARRRTARREGAAAGRTAAGSAGAARTPARRRAAAGTGGPPTPPCGWPWRAPAPPACRHRSRTRARARGDQPPEAATWGPACRPTASPRRS